MLDHHNRDRGNAGGADAGAGAGVGAGAAVSVGADVDAHRPATGARRPGPRKVNRRDPEKRREQNRAAQKVYRERQKQKLRDLETQLHQAQKHQPDDILVSEVPDFTQPTAIMPELMPMLMTDEQQQQLSYFPTLDNGLNPLLAKFGNFLPLDGSDLTADGFFGPGTEFTMPSVESSLQLRQTTPSLTGSSNSQEQYGPQPPAANNWLAATNWSQPQTAPWMPRSGQMGKSRPTEATNEDDVIEVERAPAKGTRWVGVVVLHCACREYHEPKGDCWGNIQIFPDPMRVRWREPTPESIGVPDIYRNTLQIHQYCVSDALRRNLAACGIPDRDFCADEAESPFYDSTVEDSSHTDMVVASVQTKFKTLKRDLRPSRTQIMRRHHPYVDVFPMPSVRKRLIELQYEIDEDEFFEDAIRGFRCWGSRRESQKDQGHGTGTAWDMRSWEATPEFLEKWACILGDEDGEVARQSRWWRVMRGEEEDDD